MATMPRSLRIPDDVWTSAVSKAREEGTTVTAVVVSALRAYLLTKPPRRSRGQA